MKKKIHVSKNCACDKLTKAEESAKKEKVGLDAVLDAIGDGISIQGRDFRILYQNKAHIGFMGNHKGEFCYRAYEHRSRVCAGCPVAMSFKDGKNHTVEMSAPGKNGARYFEITASPLNDASGKIVSGIESARDITSRKSLDLKLNESEAMLTDAQRIARVGNWSWNIKTDELYWSDENYIIFGMRRTVKPNVTEFMRYVHPDDKEFVAKAIDDALHKKKQYDVNMRIIRPDGTERIVNSRAIVAFDRSGKPERMAGTVQDITERHNAEAELMKFKLGLERSTDAVFITSKEGNIVYVNPAFEKIYGFKKEEALGKTPRIIKSGQIQDEQYKQFWDALLSKQTVAGEIINKRKDGSLVPIEGSNNPILDEKGNITGFLAIHHDITVRKKAEEERNKLNRELHAKIEELERFNKLTVGRELKMIELKKRIRALEEKAAK